MENDIAQPLYYLQDSRSLTGDNLMFWGIPSGYTSNVGQAEVWTEDKAFSQNHCRPEDIPWPVEYVHAYCRHVVDMQTLKANEAAEEGPSNEFYLLLQGDYIGNDVLFAQAGQSDYTTDLSKARVFNLTNEPFPQLRGVLRPKSYVDARKRLAMTYKAASLKKALGEKFTRLTKRPRPKAECYRCEGCGIFMSIGTYYAGDCRRCGTDNRP